MHETNSEQGKPSRLRGRIVVLVAIPVLVTTVVMVVLGYRSSIPPKGPPIAVLDIGSGVPFELSIVSRGSSVQVWLDAECDDCSYPIEGSMRLVGDGRTLEGVEIAAGRSKGAGWEGGKKSMSMRGVLEADALPAGATMTLSGILTVYGARDALMHRVRQDAPAPRVQLLRLTITE